ncbi:MAG: polyribonucleotide nucleotidyltransferase [Nitrospirae bacterium]|nr:polyribonucleotide nucleotidyltransferase [Nitrospirota bacterium]MBI5694673.1 polyribonucleotide nucleotidyltransferase [Nitrospirota bacterium]
MMHQKVELELRGRKLTLETGKIARQASGAVVATYGDTIVLATAVATKVEKPGQDFFPLSVDYLEKTYAAGKIPGGFFKREGRLTEKEILTSRLIDRPLRPLFPKGFLCDTQIIANVLSFGDENISDMLALIASSAALSISDVPFSGPVSAVRIGRINGEFVVNPSLKEMEETTLELTVAGTAEAIMMVESWAKELSEEVMLDALELAHQEIKKGVALQDELRGLAGLPKREVKKIEIDQALVDEVTAKALAGIAASIQIPNKTERQKTLDNIQAEIADAVAGDDPVKRRDVSMVFHDLEKDMVRKMILEKGVRADGRGVRDIRQITCDVGILPRVHGSALFTRGETQALVAATLGTSDDAQRIDSLEGESSKTFMLHYNFPPYSVGEAKFLRGPGRREIGHGALAEKSLRQVLPTKEDFPYTIRVVSDITESNGSSSMASVCGGTLALMDGGVPIKAPVAGIAMGLIKEGDNAVVLSDILGLEDHLGDMDFKVTGTSEGVCALQMDIKIAGVTKTLMKDALAQAKEGRLHILGEMAKALTAPRETLSPHAPRIFTIYIKPDKIREVIGSGGKVIRSIVEQTGCKIDIEDTGAINIASSDGIAAQKAIDIIQGIVSEPEVGRIYKGKVRKIMDFGAFVEITPGTDGLLHISQIAEHRVTAVTDELKEGDEVMVKVLEVDRQGKIRLSAKEAARDLKAKEG